MLEINRVSSYEPSADIDFLNRNPIVSESEVFQSRRPGAIDDKMVHLSEESPDADLKFLRGVPFVEQIGQDLQIITSGLQAVKGEIIAPSSAARVLLGNMSMSLHGR